MKRSLTSLLRRALTAVLVATMLGSNVLAGARVAAAVGSPPQPGGGGASPPGVSAVSPPTVVGEIVASRTADSSTYQLSDGSRHAEIFTQPIHYRDSSGKWEDVDPTLVPSGAPDQTRARATSFTETFGSDESSESPVTVANGAWSLGMGLVGGDEGRPITLGNRAVYQSALPDTQLAYESRRDGVKDTLTLASRRAPDTFTFFVRLKGLALYSEPGGGGFALYDATTHQPAGRIEPLSVFDSADKLGGLAAACPAASMTVAPAPGGVYVTYHILRTWLDDRARAYPVYVDPSVVFAGPDDTRNDTWVGKTSSSYHYADNHLDASLFASGDLRRALVNFQMTSLPRGSTINSAKLQMYLWQNSSGGAFTTMCQPVMGSWGYNATWANTFGNGSVTVGSGGAYEQIAAGPDHYAEWDVTSVVQRWLAGTLPNNGFVLYASSETAVCQHSFWSAEYASYTSRRPHLTVDYTPPSVTIDPVQPSVRPGDRVAITVHGRSRCITSLQARIDGRLPSGATTTTAQFAFSTTSLGAG